MIDRLYQHYSTYIIRLYRIPGTPTWRATLVSIQTGERRQFRTLAELYTFLEQTSGTESMSAEAPPEAPEP